MSVSTVDAIRDDRRARKNVYLLAAAQALYGGNTTIVMTLGGVVGHMLAADKSLATLPITTYMIGTAMCTVPASLLMRRLGRRTGFMVGATLGFASALTAIHAIFEYSFALFCVATFLTGTYQSFALYYRFAAADTASEDFKAKAISWVLAGGVVAALLGPQLVIWTKAVFAPVLFAGTFTAAAALSVMAFFIVSLIDIPLPPRDSGFLAGRPLREIAKNPRFIVAVLCGTTSYVVMNLVMTSSPLAMLACDHTIDDAAFVIQWHAVAMFAPSFFTGHLINRFGKERVIGAGLIMMLACGIVALSGLAIVNFWVALVLLGAGWNFGFVGATAMITDCHRPLERNKVQAVNDLIVFTTVALGSLSSGYLLNSFGWNAVAMTVFPCSVACLGLLVWLARNERAKAAA